MADVQPSVFDAAFGAPRGDVQDRVLVAGEHRGGGAVQRRDVDTVPVAVEQWRQVIGGQGNGEHRAALRQRLHEAAPGGDEPRGVGQGEHSGDVGGGQLADGVAEQVVGAQPPALDEPVERRLHGEQGGLGVLGPVEEGRFGAARLGVQDVEQGAFQFRGEGRAHLVQARGEGGVAAVQGAAHADALAALAGEDHGDPALPRHSAQGGGRGPAVGQRGERAEQLVPVRGQDHGTVFQGGAGGGQRVGDVRQRQLRVGREVVVEPGGLGGERGVVAGGQQDRQWLRR
ncbi:Uncharacterised protein [Streptomyces griseus]|nr:Uncharacterised protein [Streptomyces griseus]